MTSSIKNSVMNLLGNDSYPIQKMIVNFMAFALLCAVLTILTSSLTINKGDRFSINFLIWVNLAFGIGLLIFSLSSISYAKKNILS